eukprot:56745_1
MKAASFVRLRSNIGIRITQRVSRSPLLFSRLQHTSALNQNRSVSKDAVFGGESYNMKSGVPEMVVDVHESATEVPKSKNTTNILTDIDPFDFAKADIDASTSYIMKLVGTDNSKLALIVKYLKTTAKHVRPTLAILLSRALSSNSDTPLGAISSKQVQLAGISQLIHTASLFHDAVSDTNRPSTSEMAVLGNKMCILGGDFCFAHSSTGLAKLETPLVVELMAKAIESITKGSSLALSDPPHLVHSKESRMNAHTTAAYYRTAALMAQTCRSVAVLNGSDEKTQTACLEIGKRLGIAYHISGDCVAVDKSLSKGDLNHITALPITPLPVLQALDKCPNLMKSIQNGELSGHEKQTLVDSAIFARSIAVCQGDRAHSQIMHMPESPARAALVHLAKWVAVRTD